MHTSTIIAALAVFNQVAIAAPTASISDNGAPYHYDEPDSLKHLAPKPNIGSLIFHWNNGTITSEDIKTTAATSMSDTVFFNVTPDKIMLEIMPEIMPRRHGENKGHEDYNGPCMCTGHGNWCGGHRSARWFSHHGVRGQCDPSIVYSCKWHAENLFFASEMHLFEPVAANKCEYSCMPNKLKTDRCMKPDEADVYFAKKKAEEDAEKARKEQEQKEYDERVAKVQAKQAEEAGSSVP